jgi:hypothetical protein
MGTLTLHELINLNRDEIIRRCELTSAPPATEHWMKQGVSVLLDQLMLELRDHLSRATATNEIAAPGGDELVSQTSTPSQVTQPLRGVGGAVVELALELNVPLTADDVLTLDRCLDAAIAHAITQHVNRQKIASDGAVNELHDLTDTAISAFEVLQTGTVGVIGRTAILVHRSLMDIRALTAQTT